MNINSNTYKQNQFKAIELLKKNNSVLFTQNPYIPSIPQDCYITLSKTLQVNTLVITPSLFSLNKQNTILNSQNIKIKPILRNTIVNLETHTSSFHYQEETQENYITTIDEIRYSSIKNFILNITPSLLVVYDAQRASIYSPNYDQRYSLLLKLINLIHFNKNQNKNLLLLITPPLKQEAIIDISNLYKINSQNILKSNTFPNNLNLLISPISNERKNLALSSYIYKHKDEPIVIYTQNELNTNTLLLTLNKNNRNSNIINKKTPHIKIDKIRDDFINRKTNILILLNLSLNQILTNFHPLYIKHIIHFEIPLNKENYINDILIPTNNDVDINCILLANIENRNNLYREIPIKTPEYKTIFNILENIKRNSKNYIWCIQTQNSTIVNKLLLQLELYYYIKFKFNTYEYCKYIILRPIEIIFENIQNPLIFHEILSNSTVKHNLRILKQEKFLSPLILNCLIELKNKNYISLELFNNTSVYEILDKAFSTSITAKKIESKFKQTNKLKLIDSSNMIETLSSNNCIYKNLFQQFSNSNTQNCNRCSVCTNKYKPWK